MLSSIVYTHTHTHTRVKHHCNEHLTRATALTNTSTRVSPHVWSHLEPHATSHVRTHTCGLLYDTRAYPCHVCNRDHTQSFIYTMHHAPFDAYTQVIYIYSAIYKRNLTPTPKLIVSSRVFSFVNPKRHASCHPRRGVRQNSYGVGSIHPNQHVYTWVCIHLLAGRNGMRMRSPSSHRYPGGKIPVTIPTPSHGLRDSVASPLTQCGITH